MFNRGTDSAYVQIESSFWSCEGGSGGGCGSWGGGGGVEGINMVRYVEATEGSPAAHALMKTVLVLDLLNLFLQ